MRNPRSISAIVIVLTALAAATPAHSAMPLQCGTAVGAMGLTDDQAEAAWEASVTSSLGGGWANFDLARNKQYGQINLALAVMHTISAVPCSHVKLTAIDLSHVQLQRLAVQP